MDTANDIVTLTVQLASGSDVLKDALTHTISGLSTPISAGAGFILQWVHWSVNFLG